MAAPGPVGSAATEATIEIDRRRSARAPLHVRVSYATVDALFAEFSSNVNEGGMFVATETPPEIETRVALKFELPGSDEPIRANGRVAWVQSAQGDEPAGMGIEFEELNAKARAHIDRLIRQLRSR